jgi:tetratricopeptide (TPR) repeat protein
MLDVWMRLAAIASRAERHDVAYDAFKHALLLQPDDSSAQLGAATALLRLRRLDEARQQAQRLLHDPASAAPAHELLARIALARRDIETARSEAALAEAIDGKRPVLAYVNGRIALDRGRFDEALDLFEQALASLDKAGAQPLPELRLYAADALLRLSRFSEAEYLLLRELHDNRTSPRARASLASLYRATGRTDEASALTAH